MKPDAEPTAMSIIEGYLKRHYGPHTKERIVEETGISEDLVRTSLHYLKRRGAVALLRSRANTNLWLYTPKTDKRKRRVMFLVPGATRSRGERIDYPESSNPVRPEPGDDRSQA